MFLQVTLADEIEVLRADTFNGWERLETVILPSHLKKIEKGAFKGCGALHEIHIPSTVEEIEEEAFCECFNLTIYISNRAIAINNKGFEDCLEVITQ